MCSCLRCSVAGVYVCVCVAHTICLRNEFGVHTACWGYADMHARKISVLCMRSSLSSIYLSVCLSVHTHTHTQHTHTQHAGGTQTCMQGRFPRLKAYEAFEWGRARIVLARRSPSVLGGLPLPGPILRIMSVSTSTNTDTGILD